MDPMGFVAELPTKKEMHRIVPTTAGEKGMHMFSN